MELLNKFSKITKNLVGNSLWSSQITYVPRTISKNGLEITYVEGQTFELFSVIENVNKNLVDNVKILPTDLSLFVDKLSLQNPTINDLIKFNDQTYKIVTLNPVGILNNTPVGWQIIIRIA